MATARNVAIAAVAAVAGFGIYTLLGGGGGAADSNLAPHLNEEETKAIMQEILQKYQATATRMVRGGQNLKQQIEASGQQIDDQTIMAQFIFPHAQTALREDQNAVLDEYDITEEELEEATKQYIAEGDEDLANIAKKIKKLYIQVGGDLDISTDGLLSPPSSSSSEQASSMKTNYPPGSEELCLAILEVLSGKLLDNTDQFVMAFKQEYGIPQTAKDFERFQQGLMVITEGVEQNLLIDFNISQEDFKGLLMKHQESRQIQELVVQMQIRNQAILQKHGIAMQMQ